MIRKLAIVSMIAILAGAVPVRAEPVSAAIIGIVGATGWGATAVSLAVGVSFSRGLGIVRKMK